jgi:hypothetical protein
VAPLALFRLMQRRLTLFDLSLNSSFNYQYLFAKALYHTFAKSFQLAANPRIPYEPYNETDKDKEEHPEKYKLQGIPLGKIDNIVDALVFKETDNLLRILSFGEFERIYSKDGRVCEPFQEITSILVNFHPDTSPVLWRILLTQACLYRILKTTYKENTSIINIFNSSFWMSKEERNLFLWRTPDETDREQLNTLTKHFEAAQEYLRQSLP